MIISKTRTAVECQCEMCGQEFTVARRDFLDEESARYCLPCQRLEVEEMALQWLRGPEGEW